MRELIASPSGSRTVGHATITETVRKVVPQDATRIEAARAIQKYLRTDGGFRYSLDLPETVKNDLGQDERPDPISLFLRSKVGYCVQFATAMVMMAREAGIPARLAIAARLARLCPEREAVEGRSDAPIARGELPRTAAKTDQPQVQALQLATHREAHHVASSAL